jgi:hypothetical protein
MIFYDIWMIFDKPHLVSERTQASGVGHCDPLEAVVSRRRVHNAVARLARAVGNARQLQRNIYFVF